MFVLTLTDDKLLKFVLIWGKSCVAFVWGEKLGWPRTLFIILLNFCLNRSLTKAYTIGLMAELNKINVELAASGRNAPEG